MTVTIEQIKQKQVELEAMIKAYEEQQEETEFPKEGEAYYVRTSYAEVVRYINNNDSTDEYHISRGLFGRTVEELNFKEERLKVFAELERCGGVFKAKFDDGMLYCFDIYECQTDVYEVRVYPCYAHYGVPYMWFSTKEAAQKALDTIGEERLLKYWFRVEV